MGVVEKRWTLALVALKRRYLEEGLVGRRLHLLARAAAVEAALAAALKEKADAFADRTTARERS